MLLKKQPFYFERLESLNLDLVLGCTVEEVISFMGCDLIEMDENIFVFRLNRFKFFWRIKYYYFYFKEGKVVDVYFSRFRREIN